mmetsp:Transcript_28330/g.37713  ORF Transcript_28330/g.37713 Transcript_28330/m.37713 type:complete len:240 (-) Transcript_28330:72-791(-)
MMTSSMIQLPSFLGWERNTSGTALFLGKVQIWPTLVLTTMKVFLLWTCQESHTIKQYTSTKSPQSSVPPLSTPSAQLAFRVWNFVRKTLSVRHKFAATKRTTPSKDATPQNVALMMIALPPLVDVTVACVFLNFRRALSVMKMLTATQANALSESVPTKTSRWTMNVPVVVMVTAPPVAVRDIFGKYARRNFQKVHGVTRTPIVFLITALGGLSATMLVKTTSTLSKLRTTSAVNPSRQ